MGKRGKGPQAYPVPEGPHVGGKPLSELTAKQKAAVIELGLIEEEWDTCTWHVYEDDMNKLKPAERRAVTALGFDSKSWFLFCCYCSVQARRLAEEDRTSKQECSTAGRRGKQRQAAEAR